MAVVYQASRIKVVESDSGLDFVRSGESLDVQVAGVAPSSAIGDAELSIAANGDVCFEGKYTVLGVGIGKDEVDLELLNGINPDFGLPIPVTTNMSELTELDLKTLVRLPGGNIHVGLANVTGEFTVRYYDPTVGDYRVLVDSSNPSLDVSYERWRRMVGGSTDVYSSETPVYVTSSAAGSATLVYRYWGVIDDMYVEDEARQVISSIDPLMMADYNRDGAIDDADVGFYLSGLMYRFWNNPAIDSRANGTNSVVDFFPVKIDMSRLTDAWGDLATYTLRNWDADIRCCALDGVAADEASSIWTDDVRTKGGGPFSTAIPAPIGSRGIDLGTIFPDGQGILAVTAGDDVGYWSSPEIVVHLGEAEVYSFRLPMSLRPVRDMYRFFNIRGCCGDDRSVQTNSGDPVNLPDDETDGRHFVFVHGYNVNPGEARDWADAMFKRLLLSGSRSAFTAVTWRGDYAQLPRFLPFIGGDSLNYYQNVQNAFESSLAFKNVYDGLFGRKVLVAHSLGNMLVSSAIVDQNLNDYVKYYMLNAAVPMEAYDAIAYSDNMVDAAWRGILQHRASRWFQWFAAPDFRAALTWRGRFGVLPRAENCYSTSEDVLENATLSGLGGVWAKQELFKGGSLWYGVNLTGSNVAIEGGWGVNSTFAVNPFAYLPEVGFMPNYFEDYTRDQSISMPLFTPFADSRLHSTNALNIADASLRAKMLGDAIPAESFAAGCNELRGFDNYDYQEEAQVGFGENSEGDWLHSEIKNASFRRVRVFFKHIVED